MRGGLTTVQSVSRRRAGREVPYRRLTAGGGRVRTHLNTADLELGDVCHVTVRTLHTGAMPLVSVVLIFLDEERFIEEAVQSVREQTLKEWELILVDDGSTDRSTMIAHDLAAHDERIRYVDHAGHKNRG